MISIDNTMTDMEQMDAVRAATSLPVVPAAEPEKPAGEEKKEEPEKAEVVEETDPDAEDGEADEADAEAPEQPEAARKRKNGYKTKIERLQARNQELETQLASGGKTAANTQEAETQYQVDSGKPTLAQFDGDLDKFTEAMVDWKAEQKVIEAQAKQQAETWESRVKEAAKEFKDFNDYVNVVVPMTPYMRDFVYESEIGPKLVYALAKDLTEAQRIAGMTPVQQGKALDKLELQLTGTPAPPVQQITKASAPPPIKPLAGGSTASVVKDPRRSDMSPAEYNAWRNSGGK